jgi:hypothetical protein
MQRGQGAARRTRQADTSGPHEAHTANHVRTVGPRAAVPVNQGGEPPTFRFPGGLAGTWLVDRRLRRCMKRIGGGRTRGLYLDAIALAVIIAPASLSISDGQNPISV